MHRNLNIMLMLNSMIIGGIETYNITLATELKRRGHNVVVASRGGQLVEELTRHGIKHYSVQMPLHGSLSPDTVQHHNRYLLSVVAASIMSLYRTPHKPYKLFRTLVGTARVINLIRREKIDIIHASHSGPALVAYLASLVTRVPFVSTVHGTSRAEFPPVGLRFFRRNFGRIIAVSDEVKEHLASNYGIDEARVSVIYNGLDLKRFFLQKKQEALTSSSAGTPIRVAHIMGSGGAVPSVIEAAPIIAKAVPSLEMLVVRSSTELDEATLLAREVNRQLARETVKVIPPTKDILPVIRNSEVVIATGRCVLEAMACGKPVVVAGQRKGPLGGSFGGIISQDNISEIKKYNFTGRNSTVVASADRVAQAVITLLRDDKYRRETGEFGRRIVEDEFDSQQMAEKIERVYLEVLEGS